MSLVNLSVSVGNELQSVQLLTHEWQAIQAGQFITKEVEGFYEGEKMAYSWHFNDPQFPDATLVVTYDDGEGFLGSLDDAIVS